MTHLEAITVYPVKGLSGQPLASAPLSVDACLPGDRRFAIAHGASAFDAQAPAWHPKNHFVTLVRTARLAALETEFDTETCTLTIRRGSRIVARGNPSSALGRDVILQFLAAYFSKETLGQPRLAEAPEVNFTDSQQKLISIISLASVRDIERVARAPVDVRRFRGNLTISGDRPWAEFDWIGKRIRVGSCEMEVTARITRCAATQVNPETAERDLNIPHLLQGGFAHRDCGVFARVTQNGMIAVGDPIVVSAA